jgi:uncharacterized protein (TIGR00661 family)
LKKQKTILVAPLNWGLGHATRCIPIVKALIAHNYNVLIASDGAALLFLRQEFPLLPFTELPSYNITYPRNGRYFKLNIFLKLPQILKTISSEKIMIKELVAKRKIDGIISDNRFGVYNKKVPSIFITHQLSVLSGNTSFFSSKLHQRIIKKFDACWVPDVDGPHNLSGKLGHPKKINFEVLYIGPLSRMVKKEMPCKYDILALLTGPEPQRTLLELKLMEVFLNSSEKVLMVRGVVEGSKQVSEHKNITIVNFLQSEDLEKAINESKIVVSRSGYTTVMDLAALEKPAFFIPTPGQYEQEYLAKQLSDNGIVPSCNQKEFSLDKLNDISEYNGLTSFKSELDYSQLFGSFEGK